MNKLLKLILIFCILISYKTSAQKKIEGTYVIRSQTGNFSKSITFSKTGIFKYDHSGHLGTEEYGVGTYILDRKKLILNYNLTKPLEQSFFESKIWANDQEKVELKVSVSDLEGKPIQGANIHILGDKSGLVADKSGNARLILNKENHEADLIISYVGYDQIKIPFKKNYNFQFTVRLKKQIEGSASIPILNQIDTLNVKKSGKNKIIIVNKDNHEQTWTRLE